MEPVKQINVPLDKLKEIVCASCGHATFKQQFRLRNVPALLSQTGQAGIVVIPVYVCTLCDTELNLNPNEKVTN
jgi:hypothetical protein